MHSSPSVPVTPGSPVVSDLGQALGAEQIAKAAHESATAQYESAGVKVKEAKAAEAEAACALSAVSGTHPSDVHPLRAALEQAKITRLQWEAERDQAKATRNAAARALRAATEHRQRTEADYAALAKRSATRTADDAQADAIRRAFATSEPGRSHPYTIEELDAMGTPEKRRYQWLIASKAGYFIRKPGGDYVHVTEQQLEVAARDLLAPAISDGVFVMKEGPDGLPRPKTAKELLHDNGRSASGLEYSYTARRSAYRESDDTFVQRCARVRPELEARFDPQIDVYLRLLGGPKYEQLLDWLATLALLDRYTSALLLLGAAGTGKDMLALACAAVFARSSGPVAYAEAISKFNSALRDQPLIHINERLPVDFGDKSPLDSLKRMITDVTRSIADKNVRAAVLVGACRILITVNNGELLRATRQQNNNDIDALDQRLLLTEPDPRTRDYLNQIGNFATTGPWIEQDLFARHIVWLMQNRVVHTRGRFLVPGGGVAELLASSGIGQREVLDACLRAVVPGLLPGGRYTGQAVCIAACDGEQDRHVWINATALREHWATLGDGEDLPEDLASALDVVCVTKADSERGNKKVRHLGKQQRRRQIKPALLLKRATALGVLIEFSQLGISGIERLADDDGDPDTCDVATDESAAGTFFAGMEDEERSIWVRMIERFVLPELAA